MQAENFINMKKLFLSLIVAAVGALGMYAQDDLVATLSHGSELSTFSGADALAQAYEAATDGDVITLSPGVFNAVNIEKAITVRGAGYKPMASNGYVSTQLVGDIRINNVPTESTSVLTFEGIHFIGSMMLFGNNFAPIRFVKSRFEESVMGLGINMSAYSCIFAVSLNASCHYNDNRSTTIKCFNCVIVKASSSGICNNGLYFGKIVATNCLVGIYAAHWVDDSEFSNCIIISSNGSDNSPLRETCSAHNCLGINSNGTPNLFENLIDSSNVMAEGSGEAAFTPIFKTLKTLYPNPDHTPAYTETFELTEEAAATYLGYDGTQVGVYGGNMPFNANPTSPQVTKFSVNSTTENGQLKVKINVE